jgi:hypothetical protein
MSVDRIVTERLCRVAADSRPIKYGSTPYLVVTANLIKQAGYLDHLEALQREALIDTLREYPELIQEWGIWSGDQRTGEGWCFDEVRGQYQVYYYPKGESLTLTDGAEACAEYIMRVVPWIMDRVRTCEG